MIADDNAEAAVVGAMLLSPDAIASAARMVDVADFHRPAHAAVFEACVDLWSDGDVADPVSVADVLRRRNLLDAAGGESVLVSLQANAGSTTNVDTYCRIVAERATARRVTNICNEVREVARSDGFAALAEALRRLGQVDAPVEQIPGDFYDFEEFLDRPAESRTPWVVPGLLRRDWRCLLVATEGAGKSHLLRSFALMCAGGRHPFTAEQIDAIRTLLVDAENPDDAIVEAVGPLRHRLGPLGGRAGLWHRPGRINLRSRVDRAALEAIIRRAQPQLVCMGPLYRMYARDTGETDETATDECQRVLDDLRTRFRFALLLEHHAPHGQGGHRTMRPHGSVFWQRWPDLGFGLTPIDRDVRRLKLERFRGDRQANSWPDEIHRGSEWPWEGKWPDGVPKEAA